MLCTSTPYSKTGRGTWWERIESYDTDDCCIYQESRIKNQDSRFKIQERVG